MTEDARTRWATYLNRRMGSRSQADFAKAVDVTDGQLSKWRSGTGGVKPETVIAIARKLGDSPLHALVEVGYLKPEEVAAFTVPHEFALETFTDEELSSEILRRIQAGSAGRHLTEPMEVVDDAPAGAPVRHLRPADVGGARQDLQNVPLHSTKVAASKDNTPVDPARGEK
jgi:transcriptional regulator with XRE-family HTH domain